MEDKKNTELADDALDKVAGGMYRPPKETEKCLRCKRSFPPKTLIGGYCYSCRDALSKNGSNPLL